MSDLEPTGLRLKTETKDFPDIFRCLLEGDKVSRMSWPDGSWIWVCPNTERWVDDSGTVCKRIKYIYIKTNKNKVFPWSPSQEDLFANDWYFVRRS